MGNLLASEEVIATMAGVFEAATEEPLAERLVRALEAGQKAGGDKRGRQSAVVYVVERPALPVPGPAGGRALGSRSGASEDL